MPSTYCVKTTTNAHFRNQRPNNTFRRVAVFEPINEMTGHFQQFVKLCRWDYNKRSVHFRHTQSLPRLYTLPQTLANYEVDFFNRVSMFFTAASRESIDNTSIPSARHSVTNARNT
jgi:hypothetical protein